MHSRITRWFVVVLAGVTIAVSAPSVRAGKVYWVQTFDDSIQRANLDGTGAEILPLFVFDPIAIAVDPVGGKIYFIQSFDDKVLCADLNGASLTTVLAPPQVFNPVAIAVDSIGGKIYCAQSFGDKIIRANLNGTGVETIIAPPISLDPVAVAVDSAAGKVYWAEGSGNRIRRANLNGGNAETVVDAIFVSGAVSIAVDGGNGKLYWAERSGNRIRRADTTGLNVNVVTFLDAVFVSDPVSIALDPVNTRIYWAEGTSSRIRRADLTGADVLTVLQPPLLFDPLSIAVDPTPEACCFADGSCENLDPPLCGARSGFSEGPGTTCTALQACCLSNGACDDLDPLCCERRGGLPQGAGTNCTTVTCPVPPLVIIWNSDPLSSDRTTRSLRFTVQATATTTPGQEAIKVTMIDLQHPNPRNSATNPPANYTTFDIRSNGVCSGGQFNGHHCDVTADCTGTTNGTCNTTFACTAAGEGNGCARWVGKPGTFYESEGPPQSGPYLAARLQCTPFYWDWISETASTPLTVVGAEIVPSSEYSVQVYAVSCMGAEAACTNVSAPVTMYTRRFGDVDAPYNPGSTPITNQPNATDIAQLVNKFKNLLGAPVHARAQLQPNLPELNASINALDIVAVVDAFKGLAYAFSGPCPCPSTQACGLPCAGCAGMCVKTCTGGANDGDPCISAAHCPGGTCGNPLCRDRCGRCTP